MYLSLFFIYFILHPYYFSIISSQLADRSIQIITP